MCSPEKYHLKITIIIIIINKANISVLALLDFSSAFDTIDHSILVHRFHTDFGFAGTVLQRFSFNQTDRLLCVFFV